MIQNYSILVDDTENESMLWHAGIEIAFVLNGYGTLFMEGNKYEVQEEDIFVVNSYQIHRIELKKGSHLLSVLIEPGFVAQFFPQAEEYSYDCKSFLCPEQMKAFIKELKRQVASVISVWSKSREEFSELHMNIQLAGLVEYLVENFGRKKDNENKKEDHWLDLVRYMNESYQENITLQMLAKREFMSQSYFSRMFQKEMGVTFTEFLTEIRLSHALNLLANKELTVTDICFETGFRNVNSFIESFKQKYKKTPGQYRKEMKEQIIPQKILSLEDGMEFSALFAPLMKYMQDSGETPSNKPEKDVQTIKIYGNRVKGQINPVWKELLNVGYAKDLLNARLQEQIKRAGREIGFRYIRFHGLLDDDMVLYREKEDGTPVLNYCYVDQVLDFVMEQRMIPYIEFGYMPSALAEHPECSPFLRGSVISFPKDMEKWKWMIQSLLCHWQSRYGKDEVKKWMFSPLFCPDMLFFYQGAQWGKYLDFYELTWKTLKACDKDYKIVASLSTVDRLQGVDTFLEGCEERGCMPEWVGLVCFHTADAKEEAEENLKLVEMDEAFPMAVSGDRNYLASLKENIMPSLVKYGIDQDHLFLAEWNSNVWQRDLVNDTCYKAAFFFKNILENIQQYAAFGYWVLSDFMEEIPPAEELFHGGFGLFTTCGIPKSGYQALCLLNKLGNDLIAHGNGYMVTKRADEFQVFLYNYCHYETLYRYRHATNLSRTDRYQVFCEEKDRQFCLKIKGLEAGEYRMTHYELNRKQGSAYDAWVDMGAPTEVNAYEREYLNRKSYPGYRTELCSCEQELVVDETIGQHEVMLIEIKKID